jgi:hypothetical protein
VTTAAHISDGQLESVLAGYASMVHLVVDHPERWLGLDEDPPETASGPVRVVHEIRERLFGDVTPASVRWHTLPVRRRVGWWVTRIGASAGVAAAAPRFAGALADRLPLQAALGASAAGLAVCATAHEHGVSDPDDWVPLLATVVFDRTLSPEPTRPAPDDPSVRRAQSQKQLEDAAADTSEPPSTMEQLGEQAQRTVRALWRLGRALLEVQDLLDERPRGNIVFRAVATVPVVGVLGGWLDERSAIGRASTATTRLVAA